MFVQIRGKSGAALAAIALIVFLSVSSARAAEPADFAGAWQTTVNVNIVAGDSSQSISQLPAVLQLERTGVTMGGTIDITTPQGEAKIPIEGATFEGDRLKLELAVSNSADGTTLQALMKPIVGDLGVDLETTPVKFVGWLESKDDQLTGRIDAEGFSLPGVVDGLYLDVAGSRVLESLPEPPALETPGATEPIEPGTAAGEEAAPAGEVAEPEAEAAAEEVGPPIHAGAEAEVAALQEGDLADKRVGIQMSAAKAIAEQERKRRERAEALRKIERVHSFRYDIVADNAGAALEEASVRALTSTAARLYYGNYVLLGRDLLEPYLRQNGEKFVLSRRILGQQGTPEGRRRVSVEVVVDTDALYNDLDSKHFIAEPKFRPVLAVALDESLNDEPNKVSLARVTLEEILRQVDMRVEEQPLGNGLERQDASKDPALLRQAREEAQRLDADVLVTGTTKLYGPESKVILFDQFYRVEGELTLQFIRLDSNEVIRTWSGTYAASAPTAAEAVEDCFFQLAANAVNSMTEGFLEEWQSTMLDRTDYRICITGADPQMVDVFANELRLLSPDAELYLKSQFADVAVLNANLPGAPLEQVETFLHRHRTPQFKVISTGRGRYELRVL